jgi:hypothetical protein
MTRVHRTAAGVEIFFARGKKVQSPFDFIVRYREPGKRIRTPKHIHWIIDLYIKDAHRPSLTMAGTTDLFTAHLDHYTPVYNSSSFKGLSGGQSTGED